MVIADVLEGVVHEAAVAAVVAVRARAVDQVLLRQRHQVPALTEVLALQGARLPITLTLRDAHAKLVKCDDVV